MQRNDSTHNPDTHTVRSRQIQDKVHFWCLDCDWTDYLIAPVSPVPETALNVGHPEARRSDGSSERYSSPDPKTYACGIWYRCVEPGCTFFSTVGWVMDDHYKRGQHGSS